MHELSIAMNIVDIASSQARDSSATGVTEVELDIGMLAGIEFESLEFALSVASRGSILENSRFTINRIKPLLECLECRHTFAAERMFTSCPRCRGNRTRLVRGRELYIKSLLIEQNI